MQKLELRNHLKEIILKLSSDYFIDFFSLSTISGNNFSQPLFKSILDSKTGYELLIQDENKRKILSYFNNSKVYERDRISSLMEFVIQKNVQYAKDYLGLNSAARDFYNFHKSIVDFYNLIDGLLFQDTDLKESLKSDSFKEAESEGYITFEIISDNGIEFKSFSVVVSNIELLIKTVIEVYSKIDNLEMKETPNLILADSGSDTILSIKLPPEISKSIAKIIDEIWMFLTNNKGYKLKKIDDNLSKSLSIVKKIKTAEKNKLIGQEQAGIWSKNIIEAAEQIITHNTLTKSKSKEMDNTSYRKMLSEAKVIYLTEGDGVATDVQ